MIPPVLDRQLRDALLWIARLPLLGEPELSRLLGVHEVDARARRHQLDRSGWIEWVAPDVPGLSPGRRLAFIREEALPHLATLMQCSPKELATRLPVRRADVLERVGRAELTAGVNYLMAGLADALRGAGDTSLDDACSLPIMRPADGRWWPRRTEAYGLLRSRGRCAPFFVAWDRAGAPDIDRRERVGRWFAEPEGEVAACGWQTGTVLVVAARDREVRIWESELRRRVELDGYQPFHALITTASEIIEQGALAPIWRATDSSARVHLLPALRWIDKPPGPPPATVRGLPTGEVSRTHETLRDWALHAAVVVDETPVRERIAAASLVVGRVDRAILEWVARHPWLTTVQLASLTGDPALSVSHHLARLERYHLVHAVQPAGTQGSIWLSTLRGLRLLAATDHVRISRYKRLGAVNAPTLDESAYRRLAHELGANRAFVQLHDDARREGATLAVWKNEAESSHHFGADDRPAWIRPDGSGVLVREGRAWPFLLEYDRGTLDAGNFRAKFFGYRHYYEFELWRRSFAVEPALLFVCSDDRAERRVVAVANEVEWAMPLRLTSEWRVRRDPANARGLLGPVWRSLGETPTTRQHWPPDITARSEIARTSASGGGAT
ncbi:MAG: replication-relaxation family protein [Dehalococcoidia bacterium]